MNIAKKLKVVGLTAAVVLSSMELGSRLAVPGFSGLVTSAEARIGRPLTPFSVAGVARRTVRRCAVGVYYC